jgi:arylsulfatase
VGVRYEPGRDARVVLSVDETDVATASLPGTFFFPNLTTAAAGLLVGRDRGFAVSPDYRPPFAFTGTIERVVMASGRPAEQVDPVLQQRAALAAD